jgi:hypothetical protein
VTVKKPFTSGARRSLEREKIHDVDEQDVYRTCIVGSTCVPDVHRRVKIRYGADPLAVHDREPDMDRLHPRAVTIFADASNPTKLKTTEERIKTLAEENDVVILLTNHN